MAKHDLSLFPIRLRELRKKLGRTQVYTANNTGISTTAYRGYELGETVPGALNLITLAEFYGVTVDYLLGGREK